MMMKIWLAKSCDSRSDMTRKMKSCFRFGYVVRQTPLELLYKS